ncbi:hypothetical protein FRUB_10636 [Fimbriiglobus ruber]|uniref:Uncharacterized protein n=1 Tax=Fimbriiglobus ruber TaxID=1908690 RepID=A0A225DE38_9BACT|nr:hypothetical protein FRUB_10636 [Fimbriiglobus ruber]
MRERKTQGDPPKGDGSDSPGERLVRGQPCGSGANARREHPDRGAREKPLGPGINGFGTCDVCRTR